MPDFDISKLWLSPGLSSYHTDRAAKFNEDNRGFGAEYDLADKAKLFAGMFRNSVNKDSRYAGVSLSTPLLENLRAGLLLGAIDGYPDVHHGHIFPLAAPMLSYEGKHAGLNLLALPKVGPVSPVIAAQMKFRFNE